MKLTKKQKGVAAMYALASVAIEDVCYLLNCEEKDISQEFFDYAEQCISVNCGKKRKD